MNWNGTIPASRYTKSKTMPMRYGHSTHPFSAFKNSIFSLILTPPRLIVALLCLALVVPTAMIIFSIAFATAQSNLLENRQINVFLSTSITDDDAQAYASALANNDNIHSAILTTETLRGRLINTIALKPSADLTQADFDGVIGELNSHAQVDFVDADSAWLAQNYQAMRTTRTMAGFSYLLITLSTIALVFWISFADLRRQRAENRVLNQLGASSSTMLTPLTMRCLLLNIAGVAGASLVIGGLIKLLPKLDVMSTYLHLLPTTLPLGRIFLLILLAAISSFLTVRLLAKRQIFSL